MPNPHGHWDIRIGVIGWGIMQLVLSDCDGWISDRLVHNGPELYDLLKGWERHYGCSARVLFVKGLYGSAPNVVDTMDRWNVQLLPNNTTLRSMQPGLFGRLSELTNSAYRPRDIVEIQKAIAAEIREAEFHLATTGDIDPKQIERIVRLKLEKDGLCLDWIEGRIG
jgi:hypothetical protein